MIRTFLLAILLLYSSGLAQQNKGLLEHEWIVEASGIDASVKNPGILWTHNDSGDTSRIFALDSNGNNKGTYLVKGISNRDWEDIAVGPGPEKGKSYIYIGEIGDNGAWYDKKYIYRIEEPVIAGKPSAVDVIINNAEVLTYQYPDGNRDAETLMVDPLTGDILIVSKRETNVHVYHFGSAQKFENSPKQKPVQPEQIATLPLTYIVGGDISDKGVLLKTYEKMYFWSREKADSFEKILSKEPQEVPYFTEPQGEAVCWTSNSDGYYTVSEESANIDAHLYYYPFASASDAEQTSVTKTVKREIAFGPYLQNMTSESVTICWSTLEGMSQIVSQDGQLVKMPEYKQHQMRMARLKSNTRYQYNVLENGSREGLGIFNTFPEDIEPFTFAVLGDTRSRHHIHQKIVNEIIQQDPLFVINTGDLVSNGDNIHDWQRFFEVNRKLMRQIPYFPVLGNHEHDSKFYFDFFDLPGNERYYHFSIGDVLFIVLDSESSHFEMPAYVKDENKDYIWNNYNIEYFNQQKEWLEHILNLNKDAGFIFIFLHQPMISIKKSRVEDAKIRRKFWGDIFERHNVQAVINGHDHHYHHAYDKGVHYITTAGGGAGLYETDSPQPETVKFAKIEHFMSADVGLNEVTFNVIDINGEELDKIIIKKRQVGK